MNIAVIGLGSMGKRRIRLIKEMYPAYQIVGIDSREDRKIEAAEQFQIRCFDSVPDVDTALDCVFVCTSPLTHNAIIHDALSRGLHVFTELNLVCDGYGENLQLAKENNLTLFLSSTFFYREEINYIRKKITDGNWNYVYHIGQYLPDWHPWENYKDFFLGDKRTNGCREILAIELPWLIDTFGAVIGVHTASDKMTGLNIAYNDNYLSIFEHENGNKGSLVVDVVSPVAVRKLEVYRENAYYAWNGTPESLLEFDPESRQLTPVKLTESAEHAVGYHAFIVENAYKNEIKEFFDVLLHGKEPQYGFTQDLQVLKLIDSMGA